MPRICAKWPGDHRGLQEATLWRTGECCKAGLGRAFLDAGGPCHHKLIRKVSVSSCAAWAGAILGQGAFTFPDNLFHSTNRNRDEVLSTLGGRADVVMLFRTVLWFS